MIDIENYVFTHIASAILEEYPQANVLGNYSEEIASFPAVTVTEIRNATLRRMQDDEPTEHYATITYEVNVYSNEVPGSKEECKRILDIVDGVMFGMKFVKDLTRRLPAIDHTRTIYRLYARYTAVVDEGREIERDGETILEYHTYRG